jgi:hypothetical protein
MRYGKRITPLDVWELLQDRGIKPSDITVEEDNDEVRIIISGVELSATDMDKLDNMMKLLRRRK